MALQKLGKYEIQSEIGRGAMGLVYKAVDPILEREVAIKTMMASMGGLDSESKARFYREAKSAAKLTHRNIVTIYDMGEEDGVPYIAMEYLSGTDLHRKMKRDGIIPLKEALDITSQILRGLHYAHEFKIVHRDIKPANVYVLTNGTVKILDFGIAKLASSEMTRTGMVLGTVDYMSPEQIRADKGVDGRSDLFSAGVILYELISGRKPFPGDAITQVMYRIVHEAPVTVPPDREIPAELVDIVQKALAKQVDQRFQTGKEFAAALENVIIQLDSDLKTINMPSPEMEDSARISTARRLYHGGSFENSAAILKSVLEKDPANEKASELNKLVTRRLGAEETAMIEPEPVAATPSRGSSLEEILEEIEQERKTSPPDPSRSDATAPDLTLRLSETGIEEPPAPAEPEPAAPVIPPTQAISSPEPAPPKTVPPVTAPPPKPSPTVPPRARSTGPVEAPSTAPPRPRPTGPIEPRHAPHAAAPGPAAAKSRMPLFAAAGVAVLAIAGFFIYRSMSTTPEVQPETPQTTAPAAPAETPAGEQATPAAVAPGFLAVDVQPWAEVTRVRDTASGTDAELPADATTPVVLDLPPGTYDVTVKHPTLGETTLQGVTIASGETSQLNHTMKGFDFKSKLPR